jgi:hypothetical protein
MSSPVVWWMMRMSQPLISIRMGVRAWVPPDRLARCSCVAVNVAVKSERKVSRKLGMQASASKLVYLATNTRLVFGADDLAAAEAALAQ